MSMPEKLKKFLERCDEDTARAVDNWVLSTESGTVFDEIRDAVQRDLSPEEEDPTEEAEQ